MNNSGVHVIQTFLSEQLSEEKQIKGRTARQGDQGSYSLILLEKDLEKFLIKPEDIIKNKDALYDDLLNVKRTAFFKMQYETNKKFIDECSERHKKAEEFFSLIVKKKRAKDDFSKIVEFLVQENKGPEYEVAISKTVCVMDATGSMGGLIQKCKATVNSMFDRISKILETAKMNQNCFQLQFAVYRNYEDDETQLLQYSEWETRPDNLRKFMESFDACGGYGPGEAVEIGLWHANQEPDVSQVILIGDCEANTPEEVMEHRKNILGENYWSKTKFSQSTNYVKEIAKFKAKKVPVHAFYVENYHEVAANFKEIAKETGGECRFLDVNSSSGAEQLTEIVSKNILMNAGNKYGGKGQQLVDEYKKRFGTAFK